MKINKGKPHLKWRGSPHTCTACHNLIYIPQQKEGRFSSGPATAQPMINRCEVANEKPPQPHNPQLSISFNKLSFKPDPLNFLPSSIKECSSPLFSGFSCGSPYYACSKLQFLCYSHINSILLTKRWPFCFKGLHSDINFVFSPNLWFIVCFFHDVFQRAKFLLLMNLNLTTTTKNLFCFLFSVFYLRDLYTYQSYKDFLLGFPPEFL